MSVFVTQDGRARVRSLLSGIDDELKKARHAGLPGIASDVTSDFVDLSGDVLKTASRDRSV